MKAARRAPAAAVRKASRERTSIRSNIYSPGCGHYAEAMTPPCAVLLDLDGTLIDSQPGILASCLAALRALGHQPNEIRDIRRVIGPPLEDVAGEHVDPARPPPSRRVRRSFAVESEWVG